MSKNVMKNTCCGLAAAAFLLPAGASMAQSLPDPLKPIGNLERPWNIFIPNYSEAPSLSSWEGFHFKPTISYNALSFEGADLNDARGMTLGVSGGYDFRYDNFVFGPTADLNYNFARGDESSVGGVAGYRPYADWEGSVGGRAGYVWDRTLIYVTGGYAFADMSVENDALGLDESNTLSGWTVGGGLEYLWSDNNSFRLEYNRVEFSEKTFDSLPAGDNKLKFGMDKISIGFVRRF